MGYAFISYSTKNQTKADAVNDLFKRNNIDTWMAPYDIPPGSKYAQVINQAIKNCTCFVLLLTNEAQKSPWIPKEIERAVNYRKIVIPVELESIVLNDEFEFYISTNQIIAIKTVDEKSTEIKKLITELRVYTGAIIEAQDYENNSNETDLSCFLSNRQGVSNRKDEDLLSEKEALTNVLNKLNISLDDNPENKYLLYKMAAIYNNLGSVYSELNQNNNAKEFYLNAIDIYENLEETEKNVYALGLVYNNMAYLFCEMHMIKSAKKYYYSSIEKRKILADKSITYIHDLLKTSLDFAIFLSSHEEIEEAIKVYESALKFYDGDLRDLDELSLRDIAFLSIGLADSYNESCEEADEVRAINKYDYAINVLEKLWDNDAKSLIALTCKKKADLYMNSEQISSANDCYKESYRIYKKLFSKERTESNEVGLISATFGVGISSEDDDEAREYLDFSYELAQKYPQNEICKKIVSLLSEFKE